MTRVQSAADTAAFVVERNSRRLVLLLGSVVLLLLFVGGRALINSLVGLIGMAPVMAIQLAFAATYIIFQFGMMFWFLSRPRRYTIKPDEPQIGMTFDNYRGQPDLVEHAKTAILEAAGGDGLHIAIMAWLYGHFN